MPLADGFALVESIGAENLPEIVFVTAMTSMPFGRSMRVRSIIC